MLIDVSVQLFDKFYNTVKQVYYIAMERVEYCQMVRLVGIHRVIRISLFLVK